VEHHHAAPARLGEGGPVAVEQGQAVVGLEMAFPGLARFIHVLAPVHREVTMPKTAKNP
jgi:hypothetical protein